MNVLLLLSFAVPAKALLEDPPSDISWKCEEGESCWLAPEGCSLRDNSCNSGMKVSENENGTTIDMFQRTTPSLYKKYIALRVSDEESRPTVIVCVPWESGKTSRRAFAASDKNPIVISEDVEVRYLSGIQMRNFIQCKIGTEIILEGRRFNVSVDTFQEYLSVGQGEEITPVSSTSSVDGLEKLGVAGTRQDHVDNNTTEEALTHVEPMTTTEKSTTTSTTVSTTEIKLETTATIRAEVETSTVAREEKTTVGADLEAEILKDDDEEKTTTSFATTTTTSTEPTTVMTRKTNTDMRKPDLSRFAESALQQLEHDRKRGSSKSGTVAESSQTTTAKSTEKTTTTRAERMGDREIPSDRALDDEVIEEFEPDAASPLSSLLAILLTIAFAFAL